MKKYSVLCALFVAMFLTGVSAIAQGEESYVLQTKLYIGAKGESCYIASTELGGNEQESAIAAIGAALLPRLIDKGLGILGSAIRKASRADDASKTAKSNPVGFSVYDFKPSDSDPVKIGVVVERRCLRIVVADFPSNGGAGDISTAPDISPNTLHSSEAMKAALSEWLSGEAHKWSSYREPKVRLYMEYEMQGHASNAGMPEIRITPVMLWYPQSVHGKKYKLVSLQLEGRSSANAGENPEISVSTVFSATSGLSQPTRLGRFDLDGIHSELVSGSKLSAQSTATLSAISVQRTDLSKKQEAHHVARDQDKVSQVQLNKNHAACMLKATADNSPGKADVLESETQICDFQRDIEREIAAKALAVAARAERKAKAEYEELTDSLDHDGPMNFTFTVTETTKPDKFLLALSEAIDESRADLVPPLAKVFLGPQKTDADRIAEFQAEWDYESKKAKFDRAKADYEALIVRTDPEPTQAEIDTAYDTYRQLGRELGELAIKTGRAAPIDP